MSERDWTRTVQWKDRLGLGYVEVDMETLYQLFKARMEREQAEELEAEAARMEGIDWREDGT